MAADPLLFPRRDGPEARRQAVDKGSACQRTSSNYRSNRLKVNVLDELEKAGDAGQKENLNAKDAKGRKGKTAPH